MSDVYAPSVPGEWGRIAVADGVEIAYTERGSGPPLVFVPGWTMSGEVFEHQLTELASDFRVITLDPAATGARRSRSKPTATPSRAVTCSPFSMRCTSPGSTSSDGPTEAWPANAAVEQAGARWLRSMTMIDMTPRPLGTGAGGEWAEADLNEFLDGFVAPVVADPEAFAFEFAAWLMNYEPEPSAQRWLATMHLATPRHVAESLLVSAMFSDYRDTARSLNATGHTRTRSDKTGSTKRSHGWLRTRPTPWFGRSRPISGSGIDRATSTSGSPCSLPAATDHPRGRRSAQHPCKGVSERQRSPPTR